MSISRRVTSSALLLYIIVYTFRLYFYALVRLFRVTYSSDSSLSLAKSSFLLSRFSQSTIKKFVSSNNDLYLLPSSLQSSSVQLLQARFLYSYSPKDYVPYLNKLLSKRPLVASGETLVFGHYFQNIGHISLIDIYNKCTLLGLSDLNYLYVSSKGLCSNNYYLDCICSPCNIPIWNVSPLTSEEISAQSSLHFADPSSIILSNQKPVELYKAWNMVLRAWSNRPSLCTLSPRHVAEAKSLLRVSKSDLYEKFVVLHIRRGSSIDHRQSGASTHLSSYILSINYLHSQDIQVIIIGISSRDARFVTHLLPSSTIFLLDLIPYSNLLDIYCIANCYFFIGCASGPLSVAPTFGKPVLYTNAPCLTFSPAFSHSLMIPSQIYNKLEYRLLSLSESLNCDLSYSPIPGNHIFDRIPNSSEEILSGLCELISLIDNLNSSVDYSHPTPLLESTFASTAGMDISRSFLNMNPHFAH